MLQTKSQWQRVLDWRGWRLGYYFEVFFIVSIALYALGSAIFFSTCEKCPLDTGSTPKDYVAGSVMIFLPFTITALISVWSRINFFHKVLLMPCTLIVFFLLEFYLFEIIFL